jgi:hypothetical protein
LEQNASDGGCRRFVLIEADESARTLISRRLAEVPGSPPDYDFYILEPDRASHSLTLNGTHEATLRRGALLKRGSDVFRLLRSAR